MLLTHHTVLFFTTARKRNGNGDKKENIDPSSESLVIDEKQAENFGNKKTQVSSRCCALSSISLSLSLLHTHTHTNTLPHTSHNIQYKNAEDR